MFHSFFWNSNKFSPYVYEFFFEIGNSFLIIDDFASEMSINLQVHKIPVCLPIYDTNQDLLEYLWQWFMIMLTTIA